MSNIQVEGGEYQSVDPVANQRIERPKDLKWVGFALVATVCFAASGYILGLISAGGAPAKFLNSLGYFVIAMIIIITKQIKYRIERSRMDPFDRKDLPKIARFKQSKFYKTGEIEGETKGYKTTAILLCLFCGLLNLGGEFCVVFSFSHALMSLMNQGILTSIFALGSVIVLVGSVIWINEHVKMCEYFGTVFILVGTIVISLSKKEGTADETGTITIIPLEGPALSIIFALGACICFGT
jgi:drug/metabolite transporter (DMT)-like permease